MEFIDFGWLVISKMFDYANGAIAKSKVLPYPALITKLLEVNKITHQHDELVVALKWHSPGKCLRNMANDFIRSELPKRKELVREVRKQIFVVNANLQKLSREIFNKKTSRHSSHGSTSQFFRFFGWWRDCSSSLLTWWIWWRLLLSISSLKMGQKSVVGT